MRNDNASDTSQKTKRPSPHAETADARTGKRATQSGLCGDPRAVLPGDATVEELPARTLPAASSLHRRGRPRRLPWAPLAAADAGRAEGSPLRRHRRRPAAPAAADAHGMELAPLSAVEFRPWLSGRPRPLPPRLRHLIGFASCVRCCVEVHTWRQTF